MRHFTPDQQRGHLLRQLRAAADPRRDGSAYCPMVVRMTPLQAAAMWLQDGDAFGGARVEVCGYGCTESARFVEEPGTAAMPATRAEPQWTYVRSDAGVVNTSPVAETFVANAPVAETVE